MKTNFYFVVTMEKCALETGGKNFLRDLYGMICCVHVIAKIYTHINVIQTYIYPLVYIHTIGEYVVIQCRYSFQFVYMSSEVVEILTPT